MQIVRRRTTASDTEFARSVHHQAYRDVSERQFGPWNESVQDTFFFGAWDATPHDIIVCDGVPCGYVAVEERPEEIHVRELVISPEFQNRGIGTMVLRQFMDDARSRGVPVRLGTFHKNRAAALYRRLGFREIGQTDTHILFEWHQKALRDSSEGPS